MDYVSRTPRSRGLRDELERSMPGGDTRSITHFEPYPAVIESGSGCELVDVDGNRYIDLLNNYTALVHGHAHPVIVAAITEAAARGTVFPAPHRAQAALAEELTRRVASVERVRFTNSGTEAVMLAVRAARAHTGRDLIVKADGGYHGSWEQVPVTAAEASRPGTPRPVRDLVRFVPYNDAHALRALMDAEGERVAAVLLEPVMGEGVIAGEPDFLTAARELATRHGALLVLDEVVTARLAVGGRQSAAGVTPDLTTFGKIIGGGLPIGAVGGREPVMGVFDPRRARAVGHSGTFNGNPLAMAAGLASLRLLTATAIERIDALAARLAAGMADALAGRGVPGCVTRCGSLLHLVLDVEAPPRAFADLRLDSPTLGRLHLACMEEGLFIAPRGLMNTSTAMTEDAVDSALHRFSRALERSSTAGSGREPGEPAPRVGVVHARPAGAPAGHR